MAEAAVHGRLLEWALTLPLWHAEAVGGVHPVPSAGVWSLRDVSWPGGPARREQPASTSCRDHHNGYWALTGWPRCRPSRKSRPRAPVQGSASIVAAPVVPGGGPWGVALEAGLRGALGGQRG